MGAAPYPGIVQYPALPACTRVREYSTSHPIFLAPIVRLLGQDQLLWYGKASYLGVPTLNWRMLASHCMRARTYSFCSAAC